MSVFVVDASAVLAWCFPDEDSALARHFAVLFQRGDTAIAPSFWPHEVVNALLVGERRKRISAILLRSFLKDLSELPIELDSRPARTVFTRTQALSRDHGLTAYDAAYLELALDRCLPLATMDEDLIRACKRAGGSLVQP